MNISKLSSPKYLLDLERAVLATILFSPGVITEVCDLVSPDAFSPTNAPLYNCLLSMSQEGERISKSAVMYKMESAGKLTPEISGLLESYALLKDHANIQNFAYRIQENMERANLEMLLKEALAALPKAQSVTGLVSQLEGKLSGVGQVNKMPLITIGEAVIQAIEDGIKNKGRVEVSLGNPTLDNYTGGVMGGKLWFISGRSGTGKTTVALHLAKTIASNGIPAGYFSMEMAAKELGSKAISAPAKITRRNIMRGAFDPAKAELMAGVDALNKLPLYIVDHISDIDGICSKMAEMAKKHGVKLVCIDYLGLINHKSDDELYEITGRLKKEAIRLDIDIFLLVQMTKAANNQRPNNVQLRYVDVQDADIVMLIYQDIYDDDSQKIPDGNDLLIPVVWEITKNRTLGMLGQIRVVYDNMYDAYFNTFEDYRMNDVPTDTTIRNRVMPAADLPF
jgi:replicative DNA helicase